MSVSGALTTCVIVLVFVLLSAAARGRLMQRANKDGSFFVHGGASDNSGSGWSATGCGLDGGDGRGSGGDSS